jgi:diguanylate cyclase (GGDEF)-like protein
MTKEERIPDLHSSHGYYRVQFLLATLLLGNFLGAILIIVWVTRQQADASPDSLFLQLLAVILVSLGLLGIVALLGYRYLSHHGHSLSRQNDELRDTQSRLRQQQQIWQHLRDLYHQEIPEENFLQAVQVALRELLDVPRISLWFFDDPPGTMTCRSSLIASLVGARIDMTLLDKYIEALHRAPCLATIRSQQDPRLEALRSYFIEHGITSTLEVGIFVGGELRGTLCCESTQPRQWHADEINSVMGVSGLLSQFAESLRRREIEHDLYQHIHYDDVTGLPTIHSLSETIDRTASRMQAFHLVLIRVRGLGHINTLLGQSGGDEALRQVATKIRGYLLPHRRIPRLVRLPANQLAIILPGTGLDTWLQQRLGEMLTNLTERIWQVQAQPCQLRFSAGMAHFPSDGNDLQLVLQRAELALKQARQQATPTLIQYEPALGEWERQQIQIERELRLALDTEQFRLYLQPQFTTAGDLRGAEVLLRWQHPEHGLVAPGYFIDHAERSGLIRPMGYWVLEQAVDLLRGPLSGTDTTLSVNVSVQQLNDDDFLARIESLLEKGGFAPRRLVLEIVESLLATPGIIMTLCALRQLGVQLALDDFGTGYSSLRYLQEFPVDEIKLDKAFIDPVQQGSDAPLARSIIALARTLHLRLVAEGVETASQLEFLRKQQASMMQGYYLAYPEPIETFLARPELRACPIGTE